MGPVQAPVEADCDLLERVLQLRFVHRLFGANHPGPALPNTLHAAADHLGLLLTAVLPSRRQQCGWTFQEDVAVLIVGSVLMHSHHLTSIRPHPAVLQCGHAVHRIGRRWDGHGRDRHRGQPAAGQTVPEGLSHLPPGVAFLYWSWSAGQSSGGRPVSFRGHLSVSCQRHIGQLDFQA